MSSSPSNGFDLSTIDLSAGDKSSTLSVRDPRTDAALTFAGPDGETQRVEIDLLSVESTIGRQKRREFQRARLARVERGKKIKLTPESIEAEKVALLAALTTAWRGVKWQGESLDCTASNARMIYAHPMMAWLVDQIEEHVGSVEAYLGNVAAASEPSPDISSSSAS